jgi:acyl carrier protein
MKLDQILKDSFNEDFSKLDDATTLMSFGEWDSMTHMLFITRLEESYGIELSGDEIANMKAVGDVKKIIQSKGIEI